MERLNLESKEIFENLEHTSTENQGNILQCCNDIIFLWDAKNGCIRTQGISAVCSQYQELRPTEPPNFDVLYLSINDSGSRALLWGPKGILVVDLPWRCGPKLEYQNGKRQIIVRSRTIPDLDLGLGVDVLQVRWNNVSLSDSAIMVLTSDNALYHFDMMPPDCPPIEVFQVGCRPFPKVKILSALGETAVDFCFAPLFLNSDNAALLLLRGNGDVNLMLSGSDEDEFPEGQTLPISPLPDEHYLSEACAILALPGRPPGVVIATTRGVIYHTILVPFDADQADVPLRQRLHRLLVIETVLLDSGLQISPDDITGLPLTLTADPGHLRRYIVLHPSGVHSVLMEILLGVEHLLQSRTGELAGGLPESMLENLICSGRPLLGCAVFPYKLLALEAEGSVIELPLRRVELAPFTLFTPESVKKDKMEGGLFQLLQKPFHTEVEQLLQESRVLPRIRFPSQDTPSMTRENMLSFVLRLTDIVRKTTIPRYKRIKTILAQRVALIHAMQKLQLNELAELEETRTEVKKAAEAFAERVESIADNLDSEKERLNELLKRLAEIRPVPTDSEVQMGVTIKEIENKVEGYYNSIDKLQKSRSYQMLKIRENNEERDMAFSNKQTTIIRDYVSNLSDDVGKLVHEVTTLTDSLDSLIE